MKSVLIYPGTFDPFHKGHKSALECNLRTDTITDVCILLQTNIFKPYIMFDENYRIKIIKDSLKDFDFKNIKVLKSHFNYFIKEMDVIKDLYKKEYREENILYYVLIGDDVLNTLYKWHDFDEVKKLNFIITNKTMKVKEIHKKAKELELNWYVIDLCDEKNISSTKVKKKIEKIINKNLKY